VRKIQIFFLLLGMLSLHSCNEEYKEDEVSNIDKNAAIETELSVKHIDTADILITKHKIWKNNKLFREIIKTDTIPSLGDTLVSGEDKDGYDQTAKTKKDYEFYITVQ
jgi:hypothetical protein